MRILKSAKDASKNRVRSDIRFLNDFLVPTRQISTVCHGNKVHRIIVVTVINKTG